MEGQTLAELELVDQAIRALGPRLRQAGRHIIAGERLDQGIMDGIQKHKRRRDPGRLGRIEIGGSNRGIKGDDELSLRLGLPSGVHAAQHHRYTHDEPHESEVPHIHASSCPCPVPGTATILWLGKSGRSAYGSSRTMTVDASHTESRKGATL